MNLRIMDYLDDRVNRERYNDNDRDYRDRENRDGRNKIGFVGNPPKYDEYPQYEDRRRNHKEHDFEDDDFKEPKSNEMYTMGGGSRSNKMSMKELIEMASKSFRKELCDVLRYCEMAEAAEEDGLEDFAKGLKEMCYEEFTHATFLRGNLKYFGKDPEKSDPEIKKLWQKVSRKFEES